MGSSYVIIQYKSEVKAKYVKKLQKMIDEEKLVEHNGMFFSHDKYNTEYSLYVTYESGERLELKVGSKAIDKWPVDNKKFMDYAISIIPKKNIY